MSSANKIFQWIFMDLDHYKDIKEKAEIDLKVVVEKDGHDRI